MQKRICPSCLTRWYSSDSSSIWECENCGHDIPVPDVDEELTSNKNGGMKNGY